MPWGEEATTRQTEREREEYKLNNAGMCKWVSLGMCMWACVNMYLCEVCVCVHVLVLYVMLYFLCDYPHSILVAASAL